MRYIIILLSVLLLSSCGVYQIQTIKRPQITHVLGITSQGDTIQVSVNDIKRQLDINTGSYSNWRFYYDNSWYWGTGWYWNPYYNGYFNPRPRLDYRFYRNNPNRNYNFNPIIPKKNDDPKIRVPIRGPRGSNNFIEPNRGRNNNSPRVVPPRGNNNPPRVVPPRGNNNSPRVQPNRGRSNQPTRTPQYNTPRTRTTPNVIQRPSRTRSNSSVKQGNN